MIYNRYSYERLLVLLFMIIVVALTVFIETLFVGKVDVVLKHPSGIYNSLFILKRQYILILWLFFFVSNAFVNMILVLIPYSGKFTLFIRNPFLRATFCHVFCRMKFPF